MVGHLNLEATGTPQRTTVRPEQIPTQHETELHVLNNLFTGLFCSTALTSNSVLKGPLTKDSELSTPCAVIIVTMEVSIKSINNI